MSGDVVSMPLPMVDGADHLAMLRAHRAGEHAAPPCRYVAGRVIPCAGIIHVARWRDGEERTVCEAHYERSLHLYGGAEVTPWMPPQDCTECVVEYGGKPGPVEVELP